MSPERVEFRLKAIEARIEELEAIVLATVPSHASDLADGYADALEKLKRDFSPNLGLIRGRGAEIARALKQA